MSENKIVLEIFDNKARIHVANICKSTFFEKLILNR